MHDATKTARDPASDENALAQWMKDSDETQADFAQRIGVSQEQVSRYVNGKSRPGRKAANAIARETNGAVPADYWDHDADEDAA